MAYWIFRNGTTVGPLRAVQVLEQASPETLVSCGQKWLPLGRHPDFAQSSRAQTQAPRAMPAAVNRGHHQAVSRRVPGAPSSGSSPPPAWGGQGRGGRGASSPPGVQLSGGAQCDDGDQLRYLVRRAGALAARSRLAIGSCAVAFLLVCLVVGYNWWQSTPGYAMSQISSSLKNRDLQAFERYVDLERLCPRLIDDLIVSALREVEPASSGAESLGYAIGLGFVEMMKPSLTEMLRNAIRDAVEDGDLEHLDFDSPGLASPDESTMALASLTGQTGVGGDGCTGIKYKRKNGDSVRYGLGFYNTEYDKDLILELELWDTGDHWRLVAFSNIQELAAEVNELRVEKVRQQNAAVKRAMSSVIEVAGIGKREWSDRWGIDKKSLLDLRVANLSNRTIDSYHATIDVYDSNGTLIKQVQIVDNDPIRPGATGGGTWVVDHNMFMSDTVRLYETPARRLRIDVAFNKIDLGDGTSLALATL